MSFVLDANEYLGALGFNKYPPAEVLLNKITSSFLKYSLFIPRTIIKEVRRNLLPKDFKQFMQIILSIATIDEDTAVPFEIGEKYHALGLKPADAFIAAYCEWSKADILVNENRH